MDPQQQYGTVAARALARLRYAAPGQRPAARRVRTLFQTSPNLLVWKTIVGRALPPPCIQKSYFFSFPFLILILAGKLRKWEANWGPQNPQKSPQILKSPPQGALQGSIWHSHRNNIKY